MSGPGQWSPVQTDAPPPSDEDVENLRYIPGTKVMRQQPDDEPAWISDNRLSRRYSVPDEDGTIVQTRLYTIGALAAALDKSPVTIRKWIRAGVIPDSGLRTESIARTIGEAGRRLWTLEQIHALVFIATDEGVAYGSGSRSRDFAATNFAHRVRALWLNKNW